MDERYDVLVIGGGQAGLAMGYHLAGLGRRFLILDGAPRIGYSWRTRWDSLTLFTPARYSALPGLPFPADPDEFPGKDLVADYLETYAARFGLPVRNGEQARALRWLGEGRGHEVETARGVYRADRVVVATGPFQKPAVPALGRRLDPDVVQLHSSQYRNPGELPEGEVLVVGAGNSGVQIAAELALSRPTTLAIGGRMKRLPERFLGRSLFWWLERAGLMNVSVDTRMGRRASRRDFLIGSSPEMVARERGVTLAGRVVDAREDAVETSDGRVVRPNAIIWATGFRSDYSWIGAPVLDDRGAPIHTRGVTPVPGLYFLGLPWQYTRGSALIGWVGRDAEYLAGVIGRGRGRSVAAPVRRRSVASRRGFEPARPAA